MADTRTAHPAVTGRKIAILLGLACLAGLGGAAVLRWPEIQQAWYLARLRGDPSLFHEALISPRQPLREACRQYVREPEGGRELVTAFIRAIDSGITPPSGWPTRSNVLAFYRDGADLMVLGLQKEEEPQRYTCLSWRNNDGGSSFFLTDVVEPVDFLLELLPLCAGKTYQIRWPVGCPYGDGCPDLHVHVASAASIRAASAEAAGNDAEHLRRLGWPEFRGLADFPRDVEHVCLVRMGPFPTPISLDVTPSVPPGSPRGAPWSSR